jgi:hypothetical protein
VAFVHGPGDLYPLAFCLVHFVSDSYLVHFVVSSCRNHEQHEGGHEATRKRETPLPAKNLCQQSPRICESVFYGVPNPMTQRETFNKQNRTRRKGNEINYWIGYFVVRGCDDGFGTDDDG